MSYLEVGHQLLKKSKQVVYFFNKNQRSVEWISMCFTCKIQSEISINLTKVNVKSDLNAKLLNRFEDSPPAPQLLCDAAVTFPE